MPNFNTKKWVEVDNQLRGIYNTNKQIKLKTKCDDRICAILVMLISAFLIHIGMW